MIIKEIRHYLQRLPVKDASKKKKVQLNKAILDSEEFIQLWEKIKYKTVYSVEFDSEQLIKKSIASIQKMPRIDKIRILSRKEQVTMDRAEGIHTQTMRERLEVYVTAHHTLKDVITELQYRTNLTWKTIGEILTGCKRLDDFKNNP
ncbi:hypothetical protein B0I26_12312 [Anoxybacillus vitaminiphilus]|uniref:Uncharacterized protein n=1 Tax=Paranoxybacillus vitaminiphilus TaxID=581036 RepID=A0A327Y5D2_9BACL|nr:hypothetical protein [Anoxybacillus vitaminiphilus]RAK15226.1 hypothetical protein B0I26_12312 [Anoxybacillus vitaminiphilus]